MRFAYDGSHFPNGYARQPEAGTVEDALIAALQHEGYIDGSWRTGSRTDKGVHAAMNVAVCRLSRPHLKGLVPAVQTHLPDGLWLTGAAAVSDDWNPRHAATRTYTYFARTDADMELARAACGAFVGTHDFTAFARLEDRDPTRTVAAFTCDAVAGGLRFQVTGASFLWNQVRRMVHACLAVGRGDAPVEAIAAALATGEPHGRFDRMPAMGLVLTDVNYDPPLAWETQPNPRMERAWQDAQARAGIWEPAHDPFSASS